MTQGKISAFVSLARTFCQHVARYGWRSAFGAVVVFLRTRLGAWLLRNTAPDQGEPTPGTMAYEAQNDQPCDAGGVVKLLAYYLPQFHPIAENNRWWGEGFTEWTNVAKARPLFPGHAQPDLPGPLGFYDLRVPDVMRQQIRMAKQHGIFGFCFHYYWFSGKRLLELPLEQFLADKTCDMPFCLNWANENWSRRWDGMDQEILIAQQHSPEDDRAIMADVLRYFADPRYIRVDGRPVFLVYHAGLLPDMAATLERWREVCRAQGEQPPYFVMVQSFGNQDPRVAGFDAAAQFPPHLSHNPAGFKTTRLDGLVPEFTGTVIAYDEMAGQTLAGLDAPFPVFPCVCPSWDNTPRRGPSATIYAGSTPQKYADWLRQACAVAVKTLPEDRAFVFINAWNEWGEGAHLEPGQHGGYAFLNATSRVVTELGAASGAIADPALRLRLLFVSHDAARAGAQKLLLEHMRWLSRHAAVDMKLVLLEDGPLRPAFEAVCEVLCCPPHKLTREKVTAFCGECDLIFGNTAVAAAAYEKLAFLGVPIITHVHELEQSLQKFAGPAVLEAMTRHTSHYIAASEAVRQNLLARHAIAPEAVQTVRAFITPHPVAPDGDRRRQRQALGLAEAPLLVLGCGSRDWRKGVDSFVEIARRVLSTPACPPVTFVWIGGGKDASIPDPRALVRQYGLEKQVLFVGEQENPHAFFLAADLFLLPSREDPFPLVCLEAAACRVPSICFEGVGDMPVFVGQNGGFVVPRDDVEAMADRVRQLLDDGPLRQQLGETARDNLLGQHTTDIAVPHILRTCRAVAAKPAPVSVIVPNYNYAPYLDQRLTSIFEQSFRDVEVIVLDDASTDDSLAVLARWEGRAGLQIVKNERNSGNVFAQWRKGLELAHGEFIWIAEADDAAGPGFLAALVAACAQPDVVLAYSIPQVIDGDGALAEGFDYRANYLAYAAQKRWTHSYVAPGLEEIRDVLAVANCIPNVSAAVFRKPPQTLLEACQDFRCSGDWLFYLNLASRGRVAYVHGDLAWHRRHEKSVVGQEQEGRKLLLGQEMDRIHRLAADEFGPLPEATLERMRRFRASLDGE